MKPSTVFFFQILILFTYNSFGQGYTTGLSEEGISKEGMPALKIIGKDDGDLYLLKGRWAVNGSKALIIIEKYSGEDQHLEYSNEIKMPDNENGKLTDFENIFLVNGKLVLLTSFFKDLKNFVPKFAYGYYITTIDEKGFPSKNTVTIFEIEKKTDNISQYFYEGIGSKDYSSVFLYSKNITDSKLHGLLVDSKLIITKDVDIDLNYESSFSLNNFTLINGHLYFIAEQEGLEAESFSNEEKKYKYNLIDFDLKTKKQKKVNLKIGTKNPVSKVQLDLQKNNILYITGNNLNVTNNKNYSGGCFLLKFNSQTLEQITNFENPISSDLILKLEQDKPTSNPLTFLKTKKITELPSGDFIITSEHPYGNSLYVQFINKGGKLTGSAIVPTCVTKGEGIGSFYECYKNNILYLICNDSKKNLNLPDHNKLKETYCEKKNSIVILVSINKDGTWTKNQIFNEDPNVKTIYPAVSYETKSNQSIIFMQKGKKVQFLKINY